MYIILLRNLVDTDLLEQGWPASTHWRATRARAETRFRLSAKLTSQFKSTGASVQPTTGSRGVRISGSNAGYTMLRCSEVVLRVLATHSIRQFPLHSLPYVTVSHHISTGLWNFLSFFNVVTILRWFVGFKFQPLYSWGYRHRHPLDSIECCYWSVLDVLKTGGEKNYPLRRTVISQLMLYVSPMSNVVTFCSD